MHQSFETRNDPVAAETYLPLLREAMARQDLDGLLLPHDDEYLNEYTPEPFERLCRVTGFTGSAGALILTPDTAVLFIDGRYTEQARLETPAQWFEYDDLREHPPWQWLRDNPGRVSRLAYCTALHSRAEITRIRENTRAQELQLVPLDRHPVDELPADGPAETPGPLFPHPPEFAGESHADKRRRLAEKLRAAGADATVFINPNDTAWLLNVRGGDVPRTPVALCRAVLRADGGATLVTRGHLVTDALRAHLGDGVDVIDEADFAARLAALGEAGKTVLLDPASCSDFVFRALETGGAAIREGADPLPPLRAVKNAGEIAAARSAHVRDGLAMVRFLRWFEEQKENGLDEIGAVRKLESLRAADDTLHDISFDTIAGSGPNGSIIHYRVSEASNRTLAPGELFLLDSGGQYPEGTTDITRTLPVGEQGAEVRDRYTRVLKGHIALSRALFPPGTAGFQLDMLSRQPLWQIGCDFAHGTGHGVGSFLGVHEGPHGIAKRGAAVALESGMFVTIEPGYYVAGRYGIRIENIVLVRESAEAEGMLCFEPLTLAPIDRSLIDRELMEDAEIEWLNAYHAQVRRALSVRLDAADAAWLVQATRPL